jgi:Uma2 family endonuclease
LATTTAMPIVLESGDRLTQPEFHLRYSARTDIKKAELVQGVVYVPSPVSAFHAEPHGWVMGWLAAYLAKHPGARLADNITLILDENTEVQPDACLWREEPGAAHVGEDGYLHGAPQLVVEIAASSAAYDLFDKKDAYRRAGVREYIVWQALEGMINWFRLRDGEYVWVDPNEDGIIESQEFPGLRLAVPRMVTGDLAGVLSVLSR